MRNQEIARAFKVVTWSFRGYHVVSGAFKGVPGDFDEGLCQRGPRAFKGSTKRGVSGGFREFQGKFEGLQESQSISATFQGTSGALQGEFREMSEAFRDGSKEFRGAPGVLKGISYGIRGILGSLWDASNGFRGF